jgi:hypothetical protein
MYLFKKERSEQSSSLSLSQAHRHFISHEEAGKGWTGSCQMLRGNIRIQINCIFMNMFLPQSSCSLHTNNNTSTNPERMMMAAYFQRLSSNRADNAVPKKIERFEWGHFRCEVWMKWESLRGSWSVFSLSRTCDPQSSVTGFFLGLPRGLPLEVEGFLASGLDPETVMFKPT